MPHYRFFTRVDRVLRRSLGVSETAQTDTQVKPAPPVDPVVHEDEEPKEPHFDIPAEWKDWKTEKAKITAKRSGDDDGSAMHDEL